MLLNDSNTNKDVLIWRSSHLGINKYNNKRNIRNKNIFENMKRDFRLFYFIIFNNFIERKYLINILKL